MKKVIDHEGFSNVLGCLDHAFGVGLVALFAIQMDADLYWVLSCW